MDSLFQQTNAISKQTEGVQRGEETDNPEHAGGGTDQKRHTVRRFEGDIYVCKNLDSPAFGDRFLLPILADFNGILRRVAMSSRKQACAGADSPEPFVHENMPVTSFDEAVDEANLMASGVVETPAPMATR